MTRVAVATTSTLAADAAAEIAALGGNAVDCAVAAAMLTMNTEPGVCALAGGAYVTVWPPAGEPVTIDGNVAVPGAGADACDPAGGVTRVRMAYGGGIETLVGCGSVAIPGSPAALELAAATYGRVRWHDLLAPSVRAARDGFPLSAACHYYLGYSGDTVFGRSRDGHDALHDRDGRLLPAGGRIRIPHLADSLQAIADEGCRILYAGELGARLCAHVRDGGGALTRADLEAYVPVARRPVTLDCDDAILASNPPPAVGGVMLAAMLAALRKAIESTGADRWDRDAINALVRVQHACLDYRRARLDLADDVGAVAADLLARARRDDVPAPGRSAATVHTSAVDDDGCACAITASSGYGSGEMPAGTGLWLNNCLGELELNRRGLDAGPVGARLPSNMAPSIVRGNDFVLACGSPGADRITTALSQFLTSHLQFGMPLARAVAQPRLHVDTSGSSDRLHVEPGLDVVAPQLPLQRYDAPSMYFGGVGAARFAPADGLEVAADPRREGGVFVSAGAEGGRV